MNERNTYIYIHDDVSSKSLLQAYCIENGFSCVGIIGKDDLEDIENLIQEKDVKYIVLANLNRFLDEVLEEISAIFTTDLVAIVDIANDERLVNNTLNKEAFELMIKSRRSGYVRTYNNIKEKNRVAIYHMSLDPIRKKCPQAHS